MEADRLKNFVRDAVMASFEQELYEMELFFDTLKTAYRDLQKHYSQLKSLNMEAVQKMNEHEGDKALELFYRVQLEDSEKALEDFEGEYLLLIEYIALMLGEMAGDTPTYGEVPHAIDGAKQYFTQWLFNCTMTELDNK